MSKFLIIATSTFLLFFTTSLFAEINTDPQTGLKIGEGYDKVKTTCTTCHSAKLIIQNRATRQGWLDTIRWMQKTQGLQRLASQNESIILNYLSKNYAPEKKYRRAPLVVEKWYPLTNSK